MANEQASMLHHLCDWVDERPQLGFIGLGSQQLGPQLQAVDGLRQVHSKQRM
jgi:hypothetical protein